MADSMNIQKVSLPIGPSWRVNKLKREHPDSQEKRFQRHLEQEEKEKDKEERASQSAVAGHGKREGERGYPGDDSADRGPGIEKRSGKNTLGKRVDVRV